MFLKNAWVTLLRAQTKTKPWGWGLCYLDDFSLSWKNGWCVDLILDPKDRKKMVGDLGWQKQMKNRHVSCLFATQTLDALSLFLWLAINTPNPTFSNQLVCFFIVSFTSSLPILLSYMLAYWTIFFYIFRHLVGHLITCFLFQFNFIHIISFLIFIPWSSLTLCFSLLCLWLCS